MRLREIRFKIFFAILTVLVSGGALAYFFFVDSTNSPQANLTESIQSSALDTEDSINLLQAKANTPVLSDIVKQPQEPVQEPVKTVQSSALDSEELREYRNEKYDFLLRYPNELSVLEYDEEGGSFTIVFENASGERGFQIFITPYLGIGNSVTKERLIQDIPSGITEQQQNIVIDGWQAIMFFSENALMGQTREVWFTRGDYLYEVTTYRALDEWLSKIMATWKFSTL